ncbi:hypothetical protein Taro_004420 [Colocasia esculenta]|uniref:Uncharacterized protein n=1 Tax=Colocasia esculenta TaxID=4460 RepID=A0A843TK06_COLES|nr:hypothetical protein [Colocasia esculenta]
MQTKNANGQKHTSLYIVTVPLFPERRPPPLRLRERRLGAAMPLGFRERDYRRDEALAAAALHPRTPAPDHPLASLLPRPSCSSSSLRCSSAEEEIGGSSREANSNDGGKVDIDDPLGLHTSNEIHHGNAQHMFNCSPERQSDEAIQLSDKEWTLFKNALMQKFTCSSTVHVPVASDIISQTSKEYERSPTAMHLEELDDPEKAVEDKNKFVTRQEYISRLKELKIEIERAWRNEDRITSLKLSIKVTRLLMDTSVFQFYPMLFILVTDVMDMLGDLMTLCPEMSALRLKRHVTTGFARLVPFVNFFHAYIWNLPFCVVGVSCKMNPHIILDD